MRKGTCKHFNGTHHNTHCRAGVCYRDVTPEPDDQTGIAFRVPCNSVLHWTNPNQGQIDNFNRRGTCDKYEDPTAADLAANAERCRRALARIDKSAPLILRIKREHKGESWHGVETCPVCGGKLHMSHAALNGHVWGKCETDDCLEWME